MVLQYKFKLALGTNIQKINFETKGTSFTSNYFIQFFSLLLDHLKVN